MMIFKGFRVKGLAIGFANSGQNTWVPGGMLQHLRKEELLGLLYIVSEVLVGVHPRLLQGNCGAPTTFLKSKPLSWVCGLRPRGLGPHSSIHICHQ